MWQRRRSLGWAPEVPGERRRENAHTRDLKIHENHIVAWGKPEVSGRLKYCIPVGEWRNRAYRVREDLLDEWGGLSVKNGYIQRSVNLPRFNKPERFYRWFMEQNPILLRENNFTY